MPNLQLLRQALKELEAAKPAYVEAHKFYSGTFSEPFTSLVMQRLLMGRDVNYRAVLSAVPVDAVVEKLEIVDIQASDPEIADELQEAWKANQMQFVHKTAIQRAEMFGDAYIFMAPEYDDVEGEINDSPNVDVDQTGPEDDTDDLPEQVVSGVVMSYQSPLKTRVFYDDLNPAYKTHAVKRLRTGVGKDDKTETAWLYLADGTIEMYQTPKTKCGIEDFVYQEDVPNPVGEIPFIHLRNDLPYGSPLHQKAYGPQNQITKLLVNQMSGSDFNAFPQRYAISKTRSASTGGDDIDWSGQDDTVPDRDLNDVSKLVSGPGRIWDLSGFDSVGQFNSADVNQYLEPIDKAVQLMAVATGTPVYYFTADSTGGGTPTGESIRQRDARLNTKASWHQQHLDNGFEGMLYMAVSILYEDVPDDLSINIKWKPIEYVSESEKLDLIQQKIDLGIPVAVAFAEAGYDEDTVTEWLSGKPNDVELQRRVTLLSNLGDAAQKLGTAATLGLDMSNAQELVDQMLQDIANLHEPDDQEDNGS